MKTGDDFACLSVKEPRCHVDILQPPPVVDALKLKHGSSVSTEPGEAVCRGIPGTKMKTTFCLKKRNSCKDGKVSSGFTFGCRSRLLVEELRFSTDPFNSDHDFSGFNRKVLQKSSPDCCWCCTLDTKQTRLNFKPFANDFFLGCVKLCRALLPPLCSLFMKPYLCATQKTKQG